MSGVTSASIGSTPTLGTVNPGAVELMDAAGGRALKFQTDTPHLVNIGGDRLSTSVTLHPIPQGRVTVGSGPNVDIPVQGTGVLPLHCHIENSEGIVTIYPLSENLSIDGLKVTSPTRLSQGKYIILIAVHGCPVR
uniref:Pleckstrin homology-like domain family B member 1 n=1 Tax=Diabrotica virgifera virgifera TaxID=50390 RepID=A0A6P7GRG9_DIAVI